MRIYHFLGSIYFAIILIALTALMVIAGTFIESVHDSHQQAANLIYNSPFFLALLCGFFINILISALRRWPFTIRHIPFLTTHLGMLMIIAGTIIKQLYGLQGSMIITEGITADQVMISNSKGLLIENTRGRRSLPLNQLPISLTGLRIDVMDRSDNCAECYEKWFKKDQLVINGLPPLEVIDGDRIADGTPIPMTRSSKLDFYAIKARDTSHFAKRLYLQDLQVVLKNRYLDEVLWKGSLSDLLDGRNSWIRVQVEWSENPLLEFHITDYYQPIRIPLTGPRALENETLSAISPSFIIELSRTPLAAFIQDPLEDTHLYFFDPHGRFSHTIHQKNELNSVMVYDEGYGGYAVQTEVSFPPGLNELREARVGYLKERMTHALNRDPTLSPPLQIMKDACKNCGEDFIETTISFLDLWERSGHWLFPENNPLPGNITKMVSYLDWKSVPDSQRGACHLLSDLFSHLDPLLHNGKDPLTLLEEINWPQMESLHDKRGGEVLEALTNQVISVSSHLEGKSAIQNPLNLSESARLLSAYLRACDIHLSSILPNEIGLEEKKIAFETPLRKTYVSIPGSSKPENDTPKIRLAVQENGIKEELEMGFDAYAQGLRWPILNGRYLVRFQPLLHQLPYKVKLIQARQINYPGTSQAYSYESSLRFTDKRNGSILNKIVSMNHVHETSEGYRFYLSNITPATEGAVKKIQLVVNYDPARYLLTYPGCLIMALGIILLFKRNRDPL